MNPGGNRGFLFPEPKVLIYSLLVLSSPSSGHTAQHAAAFAHAAIGKGHSLHRVFFMDAGVYNGSDAVVVPQDERDPIQAWEALAENHDVELILCVSSALKRGLLDKTEAERYEQAAATVHPAFTISGLGLLIDASANSDRLITFGA